ncbi:MAG: hypothetical protein ACRDOF_09140 [Gaiellaceae bacterium]
MLGKSSNRNPLVLVALAALLAFSVLVGAQVASANNIPREGTRINLFPGFVGPTTYSADTPFFVGHGWGCNEHAAEAALADDGCLKPTSTFELFVDGKQVPSITDLEIAPGGLVVGKTQVSNFRQGLPAGTYVLEGQWWLDGAMVLDSVVTVTFS